MIKRTSMDVEAQLSRMKYAKALRHRTGDEVYNFEDPVFADFWPDFHKSEEAKTSSSLHPEIRKMLYSNLPEPDAHPAFSIEGEEDAQYYESTQNLALNYYKAKDQFFEDAFRNQMQMTTQEFLEEREAIRVRDSRMEEQLDFMYSNLDYDSERAQARERFLKEANKRTTLEDLGETLDKLVIDSKAKNWKHYKPHEHAML